MEGGALDPAVGKGPGARAMRLQLPQFTLGDATNRAGALGAPLRDRFGILLRLEFYSEQELVAVLERAAGVLGVPVDDGALREIARRARGTPRIANRLLRRLRDLAAVRGDGRLTVAAASGGAGAGNSMTEFLYIQEPGGVIG